MQTITITADGIGPRGHHKVPKGRDKRGWDFPGNMIDLCVEDHYGSKGPHKCRTKGLQYMREVRLGKTAMSGGKMTTAVHSR